jgi:hypothetical protein
MMMMVVVVIESGQERNFRGCRLRAKSTFLFIRLEEKVSRKEMPVHWEVTI